MTYQPEDAVKTAALRRATKVGIDDLKQERFTELENEDIQNYLEALSLEASAASD